MREVSPLIDHRVNVGDRLPGIAGTASNRGDDRSLVRQA